MTAVEPPPSGEFPELSEEDLARLAALYGSVDELGEQSGPTHWPDLSGEEASDTWAELAEWVGHLQDRFAHLDHHVIPRCWYRHREHVEALTALWDHEQVSYGPMAPATGVDWFRALRDIESLLRAWTAQLPRAATHETTAPVRRHDRADLQMVIAVDVAARREAAIKHEP